MSNDIYIYINNSKISKLKLINLEYGNPGIGGTEYQALLLLLNFRNHEDSNLNFKLITPFFQNEMEKIISCKNIIISQIFVFLNENYKKTIILDHKEINSQLIVLAERNAHKIIVWAHNHIDYKSEKLYQSNVISRIVCVGKQQYDFMKTYKSIKKTDFIYNTFPEKSVLKNEKKYEKGFNICYLGSLVPEKNFHILAKYWKKILDKVPNAKLHVIGSGNLYNHNASLGHYGFAEENYESLFMRYLTNNGKIIDSVYFYGKLGIEKNQILSKCQVGIVNPLGTTETFCISALEILNCNTPVMSIKDFSLPDLIVNNYNGLLYSKVNKIPSLIKKLNDNPKLLEKLTSNSIKSTSKFNIDYNREQWIKLIEGIFKNNNPSVRFFSKPFFTKRKTVYLLVYLIQKLPFIDFMSVSELLSKLYKKRGQV